MEDVEEADVIVVGAGLSGLSAAHFMHKRDPNIRIVILEAKGEETLCIMD